MKHLGDITKIDGAAVEPVEVIIGGSPCQDLSVAGKREGLSGERSGLFMEQIRIIKEMREHDRQNGATYIRPRYMVWENVPGAFSSNKGEDFRIVLEETARVVEPTAVIPRPEGGKWSNSGAIMGDGWSIAWRVFDAQFWGVPQRRRRIALVADFGGATAPEILFERKSVFGNITQSATPWKDFAAAIAKRFGGANQAERESGEVVVFNGESITSPINKANPKSGDPCHTLNATGAGRCYCLQGNGIDRADTAGCNGKGVKEGVSYTLNTIDRPAVYDYDRRHDKCQGVEVAPTVTAKYGTGGGNTPLVYDARGNGEGGTVPTITGDHQNRVTDYTAIVAGFKAGAGAKAGSIGYEKEVAPTLNAMNHNTAAVIALDRAAFNQGKNAQYDFKVDDEGVNSTIVSKGPSAICYGIVSKGDGDAFVSEEKHTSLSTGGGQAGQGYPCVMATQQGGAEIRTDGKSPTLTAAAGMSGNNQPVYANAESVVRRLTPLECERLQGFPDGWTDIGDYIDTNGKKRKTSDSARYKALGNSIALPSWAWLLERLNRYCRYHTMASLFDGIGGFPLIWEALNGKGSCLWASEIEEFPIAVTKYHFGENI